MIRDIGIRNPRSIKDSGALDLGRLMSTIGLLFALPTLVILLGCHTSVSPGNINVKGTVHHFELEGGFWAIRGDDGTTYDPVGSLPAEFQKEGLRVRLEAKARPDVVSAHMAGTMVEIVEIRRL